MNSRVSWSTEGIDPAVRERAEAAARRAGMSLSDWLNLNSGDTAPPNFRSPSDQRPADARPGKPGRRRHPPAAGRHHPPDRTDFARQAAQRDGAQRRPARRASRRAAIERSHRAPRCAALADFQPCAGAPAPDAGKAAPGRNGRARGCTGLSPLAAAQPGLVRFGDRGNFRAPERTRQFRAAADAAQRAAGRAARCRLRCRRLRRRAPISLRSSGIWSKSRARSKLCSGPITSISRSQLSAANSPKFAMPSPRQCRAGRSN